MKLTGGEISLSNPAWIAPSYPQLGAETCWNSGILYVARAVAPQLRRVSDAGGEKTPTPCKKLNKGLKNILEILNAQDKKIREIRHPLEYVTDR